MDRSAHTSVASGANTSRETGAAPWIREPVTGWARESEPRPQRRIAPRRSPAACPAADRSRKRARRRDSPRPRREAASPHDPAINPGERGRQVHRRTEVVELGAGLEDPVQVHDLRPTVVQHDGKGRILGGVDDTLHERGGKASQSARRQESRDRLGHDDPGRAKSPELEGVTDQKGRDPLEQGEDHGGLRQGRL